MYGGFFHTQELTGGLYRTGRLSHEGIHMKKTMGILPD